MIVLQADAALIAVFQKTIKVMEQNVEWNETFAINNNTLILPGKLKSLFFSFDNRKVTGNVIETEIKEEPRLMLDNKLLESSINMVLYIFGKWGKINGLTVEKNYQQLNSLINGILAEVEVTAEMSQETCRFYKDNVRMTYEEVIELILEYMKPEYLAQGEAVEETTEESQAKDDKYKIGLWHKIVWEKTKQTFHKKTVSKAERKKSRLGKDFYLSGYICPKCGEPLYMVVYPREDETVIETNEGRVILARAYTCRNCLNFYTPQPYRMLMEGDIYGMDFEEDEVAYEDYLELMGEKGQRVANADFNRFEDPQKNAKAKEEQEGVTQDLEDIHEELEDLMDEELFDLADKMDSNFFDEKEMERFAEEIEQEFAKRGINKNDPPKNYTKNKWKKKRRERAVKQAKKKKDAQHAENEKETAKNSRDHARAERSPEMSYGKETTYDANLRDQSGTHATDLLEKQQKIADFVDNQDMQGFEHAIAGLSEEELVDTVSFLRKRFSKESKTAADTEPADYVTVEHTDEKGITKNTAEAFVTKAASILQQKQQQKMLQTALAVKNGSYADMKQAYQTIVEMKSPAQVKSGILDNLKAWMQKRAEKELTVLTEHIPDNLSRQVYLKFKDKFGEYSDVDTGKYMQLLDGKRDFIEKKELAEYVKKHNKRPNDRKSLLELLHNIEKLDYEERNKEAVSTQLKDKVYAMDEAALARIVPDVFALTFDEGIQALKKIQEGDFLPELKTDMLGKITKRLESMKKDECRSLVAKLVRDTGLHPNTPEGFYAYDIKRMSDTECMDTDAIIVQNALNTYAGCDKYEYPVLIYDATKNNSGKKGFVVTPDHIYHNSSMTAGTLKVADAEEFYLETGLFSKGIYVRNKYDAGIKLSGTMKGDKTALEAYLKKLNQFLQYLKEKPESRNVAYMAEEKHAVKCCYRCGYTYKYGSVCPKCGSKNNR